MNRGGTQLVHTAMFQDRFLVRRNGVYYFRARIPKHIRSNKNEIKFSLKTQSLTEARKLARPFSAVVIQLRAMNDFEKLKKQLEAAGVQTDGLMPYTIRGLKVGDVEIGELEVDPNNKSDIEAAQSALETIVGSRQHNISNLSQRPSKPSLLLSDAIKKFVDSKISLASGRLDVKKRWTDKTADEYKQAYTLLVEITGDLPVDEFSFDLAETVRQKLLELPARTSNRTKYKDMSIDEMISKRDGDAPRSITTINKLLTRYSSLFDYIKGRLKAVDDNYFAGLNIEISEDEKDSRRSYSNSELISLFENLNVQKVEYSYQYWATRIALLSGLRLEEVIQMHLTDVDLVDGVYVFDINDKEDKKLKTKSSRRRVPIHQSLIDLGLLKHVNELKSKKGKLLFPECETIVGGRRSHDVSKWFSSVRKQFGWVGLKPKLDFHSFRTTVATQLQRAKVSEYDVACILGHKFGKSESFKRYSDPTELAILRDKINLIKYNFVDI